MSIDSYPLEQPQPDYMVVTSTTRPSNPYVGLHIFETDTKMLRYWNGTAWVLHSNLRILNSWGPIFGSAPNYENTAFLLQTGSNVVATNASGDFTITYPTPFPTGVLYFMVQQGDNTHGGATFIPYIAGAALAYHNVRMYTASGSVWANSGNLRANWLAIGW